MIRTPSLPPRAEECASEEGQGSAEAASPGLRGHERSGAQSVPLGRLDDSLQTRSAQLGGQDAFRGKFLQKLANNNLLGQEAHRPPKHQSVIIFDWDDTLLCTSYLMKLGDEPLPADTEPYLRKIAQHIRCMLEIALASGPTYIITNAMAGWVEHSAAKWVPELLPLLQQVEIISARERFGAKFPDDIHQWKVQAFLEVQRRLDWTPITNLVALGDADFEMEAARIMGGEFDEALIKTVKFRPHPTPLEHMKQVELVAEKFLQIVRSGRSTKVILERRQPRGRTTTR